MLGPGGTYVRVTKAEKHSPRRREFIELRTALGIMKVTSDHQILVQDSSTGRPIPFTAGDFKQWESEPMTKASPKVYVDGQNFQSVCEIKSFKESLGVVAITLENQFDSVMACLFQRKPRSVLPGASMACRGRPHSSLYLMDQQGLIEKSGFIDEVHSDETHKASAQIRSASEGAPANSRSQWSAGTRHHGDGTCKICWEHHRHLQNTGSPCKNEAQCDMCHAEHEEKAPRPRCRPRGPR